MYWCCGLLGLSSWVAWNSSQSRIWSAGVNAWKFGWRSPTVDWATKDGCGGKLRGVGVGVFSVGA